MKERLRSVLECEGEKENKRRGGGQRQAGHVCGGQKQEKRKRKKEMKTKG